MMFSRSFEKKISVCKIELIQHPENPKYSSELLLTRSDGYEWRIDIKDVEHSSNSEQ